MYKILYTLILSFAVFLGSFGITSAVNGLLTPGVVRQSGTVILPGIAGSTIGDQNNFWDAGWFTTLYATTVSASSTSFTYSGGNLDMVGDNIFNSGTITGTTLTATSTTVISQIVFRLGIGTSTPVTPLHVTTTSANATSTLTVGKVGQNKGTCLEFFDQAGTAVYFSIVAGATTFTGSADSCK